MDDGVKTSEDSGELLDNVALIVSSFVQHHALASDQLPTLISDVFTTLDRLSKGEAAPAELMPAVDPKRSIRREHIVCLEDGKKFQSLKRHLRAAHEMSPQQYRAKWHLPLDYPMVAQAYAERRSDIAKASGLGASTTHRRGRRKAK